MRLMRGVVRAVVGVDLDEVEAEVDKGRAALSRESTAREGLRQHLEQRLDDVSAVVEDVRGAYLATRSEFEQVRDKPFPSCPRAWICWASPARPRSQRSSHRTTGASRTSGRR